MKNKFLYLSSLAFLFLLIFNSCKEDTYSLGDLTAPTNLTIATTVVGQDTANPNGDGTGVVNVTATAANALSYKVGYSLVSNPADSPSLNTMTLSSVGGTDSKKFTNIGTFTYRITVVAYGVGGTSSVATKDVTVKFAYMPPAIVVTNLTNNATKTWKVDESVAGHFGVGPWSDSSVGPDWWSAAVNEKVSCCNCFYTATFAFKQITATTFSLTVATPDGAFTKTGSLASISGIPSSGGEGCYSYGGGTSSFSFIPSSTGVAASAPSTKVSILLGGTNTFIGYGSLKKEYEIMVITPTYLYLRVQGTETGNAWYLKLKPVP